MAPRVVGLKNKNSSSCRRVGKAAREKERERGDEQNKGGIKQQH